MYDSRFCDTDADTWSCSLILTDGHKRTIRSICWSPDGEKLASASFDSTVGVWEKENGVWDCVVNLEGHENEVKCVAWSPSGKFIATCSRDKTVWIWEVLPDREFDCLSVRMDHTQDVKRIVWHPTKDICASCSYDNSIRLFREQKDDWNNFTTLTLHGSTVWSISFNTKGDRLVSCSDDKTIRVWAADDSDDLTKWTCVSTLSGFHKRAIYDVCWSKVTGVIAAASGDDSITIYREDSENSGDKKAVNFSLIQKVSSAHETDVNCVQWNPVDGQLLASGSDDATIKIWRLSETL